MSSRQPVNRYNMRICLVTYEYPPQRGLGGVGSYMFRLAGALGNSGHEVHVVAGPTHLEDLPQKNVTLHRLEASYTPPGVGKIRRWLYWHFIAKLGERVHHGIWHWLQWNLACEAVVATLQKKDPFDLIEIPEHAANGWKLAGTKMHRCPIIARIHCPWEVFVHVNRLRFNPMNQLLASLERFTMANVPDGITVPSQAMKQEVDRSWTLRREAKVVPNFIDVPDAPTTMPPDSGEQNIVSIGRIEPLKGQDILVKAFAEIAHQYPRTILNLIGPDRWNGQKFQDQLPRIVRDEKVRSRIRFHGTVPLADIPRHLACAKFAVIASRGFESFGFSALEAMAIGRPVISTEIGGLPELIEHEQTGLIIPPDNIDAMASAMDRMLKSSDLCQTFGKSGHRRARKYYDTQIVLPKIHNAYEEASTYFYHVSSARSEQTAGQWRRAIAAGSGQ